MYSNKDKSRLEEINRGVEQALTKQNMAARVDAGSSKRERESLLNQYYSDKRTLDIGRTANKVA